MRIFGILMFACVAGLCVAFAPALWSDWQLRNQELVATSAVHIDEADCKVRPLVSFCQIVVRGKSFPMFYLITNLDTTKSVNALVPKDIAGTVIDTKTMPVFTTDLGMEYFWNRLTTFLASISLALGLGLLMLFRKLPSR